MKPGDEHVPEIAAFFSRGKANVLNCSAPTVNGQTTFSQSIDGLLLATSMRDKARRFIDGLIKKEQIRQRILEPHRGPSLTNLRSDNA